MNTQDAPKPATKARTRVCEIRFLDGIAHVVELCAPVLIPTERKVDGKTVFGTAGYTPVHVIRRATRDEVEAWRFGELTTTKETQA